MTRERMFSYSMFKSWWLPKTLIISMINKINAEIVHFCPVINTATANRNKKYSRHQRKRLRQQRWIYNEFIVSTEREHTKISLSTSLAINVATAPPNNINPAKLQIAKELPSIERRIWRNFHFIIIIMFCVRQLNAPLMASFPLPRPAYFLSVSLYPLCVVCCVCFGWNMSNLAFANVD